MFRRLEAQGVHNLELVTGTQFLPGILRALELGPAPGAGGVEQLRL